MSPVKMTSTVKGPFFGPDALKATPEATRAWVDDTLREGEAKLNIQLYPGHGVATGEYKRHIGSAISDSFHGRIYGGADRRSAVVGAWLEGGRSRKEQHRFRGYHMWRATRAHLRRLANELAGKVYSRITRRLT